MESVSNLTMTSINSTTVLISWSLPFTLEGVPILGYNVTITNTTSGESQTVLVEDTTLLYSIDHPDPENSFTVTVVPINEVGAGQNSFKKIFQFPPEPSIGIHKIFNNNKQELFACSFSICAVSSVIISEIMPGTVSVSSKF